MSTGSLNEEPQPGWFLFTHGCDLTALGPRTGHVLTSECLWGQLLMEAPGRLRFSAVSGFTGPLPLPRSRQRAFCYRPWTLTPPPCYEVPQGKIGPAGHPRSPARPSNLVCTLPSAVWDDTSPSRGFGGKRLEDHVLPTVWAFGQTRLGDVFGM